MIDDLMPMSGASEWRVAAMRFVGAAARATDRDERVHFLLCASECLDRADELADLRPSLRRSNRLH